MADDELWQQLKQLADAESNADESVETREKLIKTINRLFRLTPHVAMERGLVRVLWGSQQRLYRRMKDELDKQMALPDNGKRRELHVRVAKMNCENVLSTLYAEWTQLAMLLENSSRDEPISLLPLEEGAVSRSIRSLARDDLRRKFALVLYSRLGEISEWKGEEALSRAFSDAAKNVGQRM